MPITIVPINGNCHLIDYNSLQQSFENFLGERCTEATMYVFNRFPVPVSNDANIELIFMFSLNDRSGNYTRHLLNNPDTKRSEYEYFRNAIVPIIIKAQLEDEEIEIKKDFFTVGETEYEENDDLLAAKFGLLNFLKNKCCMEESKLFFEPIQLILSNNSTGHFKNYMFDSAFNADIFFEMVKENPSKYFKSYSPWTKAIGYEKFKMSIIEINEAISRFTDYGYLTKRKIEKIGEQLKRKSAMYDSIGIEPTSIDGKAGTGKTSHLLHLLIRCLKNNRNVTFLTYNQLLTKDIAYEVKMIRNNLYAVWEADGQNPSHFPSARVQTLMGYIYKLSKNLGVLHLMTEERVLELENILRKSIDFFLVNLPELLQLNAKQVFANNTNNWEVAIECIQNTQWDVFVKQYVIGFIKYLRRNAPGMTQNLPKFAEEYYLYKIEQIKEINYQNIFLRDYLGCLKNTLLALRNTRNYYDEFNLRNKFDLLDLLMNLSERQQDEDSQNRLISFETFNGRVNRMVGQRKSKNHVLMIDESQDCHSLEREIFYELFHPENVVVSFGGKEQLIRFAKVCEWNIFNNKIINLRKIGSGNKSYRIKQSILDFCNFIADKNNIELNLNSFSSEDTGHIIFDFREYDKASQGNIFNDLLERGLANGCSALESLMIFDVNKRKYKSDLNERTKKKIIGRVNEYGVLQDEIEAAYADFPYLKKVGEKAEFWVGAISNKRELNFPAPNEVRIINYESCRGLESWSVICFNIDSFFFAQSESDDAELYLLHEGLILSRETRASMYAITWVLMAATRAIDSLYLQLSNPENSLYKLCRAYALENPERCSIYDR